MIKYCLEAVLETKEDGSVCCGLLESGFTCERCYRSMTFKAQLEENGWKEKDFICYADHSNLIDEVGCVFQVVDSRGGHIGYSFDNILFKTIEEAESAGWVIRNKERAMEEINLHAAKEAAARMRAALEPEQAQTFDYSVLDPETAEYLKEKEKNINFYGAQANQLIGKELKEAQAQLAKHRSGSFEEWYTSIGFKKDSVYRAIRTYEFILANCDNKDYLLALPKALIDEASKPSAPKQLQEAVISGDVTTHKEYKELEAQLKQAEYDAKEMAKRMESAVDKAKELESKLEQERIFAEEKEQEVIELSQRQTRTVEKVVERAPEDYQSIKLAAKALDETVSKKDQEIERLRQELNDAKLESRAYKDHIHTWQGGSKDFQPTSIIDFKYACREFLKKVSALVYQGEQFLKLSKAEKEKYTEELDTIERWVEDMRLAVDGNSGGANLVIINGGKKNE